MQGLENTEASVVVSAIAPLANLFGYVNSLAGVTRGQASFEMQFEDYQLMPYSGSPDSGFPGAMALRP